jgi:hypothetical protein
MIQSMLIAVLLYLIIFTTPVVVMGAVQVAAIVGLTFILADATKMLLTMRKERKAKEANEAKG